MQDLIASALAGNRRAIARLITQVERGEQHHVIIPKIFPYTGHAHIIGITGAPGAGKSTLVNRLAQTFRTREQTVAIVAIDPSSPFSGGALLGDRIRMTDLYGDKGIFIRSMASRGNLGGLARATDAVIQVFDAVGFDVILVETVGAGQAEVAIAQTAQTTLVVEAPGFGDHIQANKAGILEIADILVVNKADRPEKEQTVKALRAMLQLGQRSVVAHHGQIDVLEAVKEEIEWQPPICETIAVSGQGMDKLYEAIVQHKHYLEETEQGLQFEMVRCRQVVDQLLTARFLEEMRGMFSAETHSHLITAIAHRQQDPYTVAEHLFNQVKFSVAES